MFIFVDDILHRMNSFNVLINNNFLIISFFFHDFDISFDALVHQNLEFDFIF